MNREKFIKLMMLTASDQDGEALTALRKANAMLAAENKNWEEFISEKPDAPNTPRSSGVRYIDPKVIDPLFDKLLRTVPHMSGFRDFVESVHEFWRDERFLTEKQFRALKKAAQR